MINYNIMNEGESIKRDSISPCDETTYCGTTNQGSIIWLHGNKHELGVIIRGKRFDTNVNLDKQPDLHKIIELLTPIGFSFI